MINIDIKIARIIKDKRFQDFSFSNKESIQLRQEFDGDYLKTSALRKNLSLFNVIGYFSGNCNSLYSLNHGLVTMFNSEFSIVPLNVSSKCSTAIDVYTKSSVVRKIVVKLITMTKVPYDLPTPSEVFFDEFITIAERNIKCNPTYVNNNSVIWQDSSSIVKANVICNRKMLVIEYYVPKME